MYDAPLARVLVVDDDPGLRSLLGDYLSQHGFTTIGAGSASEMDEVLANTDVDVIVLDMMMPGENGLSVCRRLSGNGAPIVMLSAMSEETDRIVGLELGAADYVGKPCNPRELLARVRAVLRRQDAPPLARGLGPIITFAGWRLDRVRREAVSPSGREVVLSRSEALVLELLIEHPGQVVRRENLLARAASRGRDLNDRAMDVQVSRLRRKLDDEGVGRPLIVTIRHEGYMFDAAVETVH